MKEEIPLDPLEAEALSLAPGERPKGEVAGSARERFGDALQEQEVSGAREEELSPSAPLVHRAFHREQ